MGTKIDRDEFKKKFGSEYRTATIAREIGYTPNTLYSIMNPNSRQTIGKEKVRLFKEKYPERVEVSKLFYECS